VSSLKPTGIIEVNGRQFDADSEDGSFLSTGTEVIICGERRGMPLVKRVAMDVNPQTKVG